MAALPYIQLYVADYLADTAHLTAAQNGAYLLLIFNYWQRGKPLDNRNDRLANVARMSNEEWQQNKEIIAEFFEVDGDTWHHARIDADLEDVLAKSTKSSAAGKASAAKRNQSRIECSTVVERSLNHTDTDIDKEPPMIPQQAGGSPPSNDASTKRSKREATTFVGWIDVLRSSGEKPISDYRALRQYMQTVGLPEDFVALAWERFKARYSEDPNYKRKRYADWRATFLNAVKDNWFKLWYLDAENSWQLTTVGKQADMEAAAEVPA